METFFPAKTAKTLSDAFSIVLPMGFVPMAILTAVGAAGAILKRPMFAFFFVTSLSMVYGGLLLVPNTYAFCALFVIFPLVRQLVFSTFFSYCASVFGYGAFGRISGVASTLAGAIQLSMSPFIGVVEEGGRWPFPENMEPRVALARGGRVPRVRPRVFARRAHVLHVQKRAFARRRLRRG